MGEVGEEGTSERGVGMEGKNRGDEGGVGEKGGRGGTQK